MDRYLNFSMTSVATKVKKKYGVIFLPLCLVSLSAAGFTTDATTERVSIDSEGNEAIYVYEGSLLATISGDGRYVAFMSDATNLVPDDTNDEEDVFVHDRVTGQTTRVSVATGGVEANNGVTWDTPRISADGNYVAFSSSATNLVPDDTNVRTDVFVHDRETGETTRVSLDSEGNESVGGGSMPTISGSGRYVAFASYANDLIPGDTNGKGDIFVHDRDTGETTRVSVTSDGSEGDNSSSSPKISCDGRYVAFDSNATNLVPDDTNGTTDVFVHDRETGETTRVSVASDGSEGEFGRQNREQVISCDGRYVAFSSAASNLVPDDTNGLSDVFVHDRETGETTRVNLDSEGNESQGWAGSPAISGSGRYVAFESSGDDLVSGDTNSVRDIFVHDRDTGETIRVNVDSVGNEANDHSRDPAISMDGAYVAFESLADNLVPDDTNGIYDIFVRGPLVETAIPTADITVTDSVVPVDDLAIPFGQVIQTTTSSETVTITNDGNADLTIGNIAAIDILMAPFSILDDGCSWQTLAQGTSCSLSVQFEPQAVGTFTESFDIPSDDPDEGSLTVNLSGSGVSIDEGTEFEGEGEGGTGSFGPFELLLCLFGFSFLLRSRAPGRNSPMLPILAVVLTLVTTGAVAQDGDWYVGAGMGAAWTGVDDDDLDSDLAGLGYTTTSNVDDTDFGWKLFGGYRFNRTWAVEGAYVNLGDVTSDISVTGWPQDGALDPDLFVSDAVTVHPYSVNGFALTGVGTYPLNERVSLFAKLGMFWWEADIKVRCASGCSDSANDEADGLDWTGGLGLSYDLDEQVGVRGEWERYATDRDDVDFFSVNILYRF